MGAIEIKELHIKINVDNENKSAGASTTKNEGAQKDMIIAECVEQVMQIISKQSER